MEVSFFVNEQIYAMISSTNFLTLDIQGKMNIKRIYIRFSA